MLKKIISGGQTGADRAGLEAALALNIPTGGYCPKGFLTEKGRDVSLKKFGLKETATAKYDERTVKNIMSSDGTVIFCRMDPKGNITGDGTLLTFTAARNLNKPVIVNPSRRKFMNWLEKNKIEILNVAGNRESQNPGIYEKTKKFLIKALFDDE